MNTADEMNANHAGVAFSKQSVIFDELEQHNPIVKELRNRIRRHVLSLVRPEETLLELNAGTGLDAVAFAQNGVRVTATDIAEGMVQQMHRKVEKYGLGEYMQIRRCSFTDLDSFGESRFDHIFSNFGGLNCAENLAEVIQSLKPLLKPSGTVTLVIMPPVSIWEIFSLLRGNTNAFRRLRKGGTMAHVEGEYFRVHYYSARYVVEAFDEGFERIELQGLSAIAPPPHAERFAVRFPRLYSVLARLDVMLAHLPIFRSCADHYCITLRKKVIPP